MKNNILKLNINILALFCGFFCRIFGTNPLKKTPASQAQTVNSQPSCQEMTPEPEKATSIVENSEEVNEAQKAASSVASTSLVTSHKDPVKQRLEEILTEILTDKSTKSFQQYCEELIALIEKCSNQAEYVALKNTLCKIRCSKNSLEIARSLQPLLDKYLPSNLKNYYDKMTKFELLTKAKRIIK